MLKRNLPHLLMLTHRVPYPPDRGDRIRSWNILKHLSQDFEISLGCVSDEAICPEAKSALESICRHVMIAPIGRRRRWLRAGAGAARGRSLTEGLFWSPMLHKTLLRWNELERFDGILVYCSSMLPYARHGQLRQIPRFVDLVDVDSQKFFDYADHSSLWKRTLYRTEAQRVRKLEHDAVRTAKAVTLVSEDEALLLRRTMDRAEHPIHGICNGVDTEYFHPGLSEQAPQTSALTEPRLCFVGVMDYLPNVTAMQWFASQVWPQLRQRYPGASLQIVGKHPTSEILSLTRLPGIDVTGAVPDVRPFLRSADMVVAPLQIARGVQNKVLEAMSMARPVVASSAAATGIDCTDGQHLCIADQPQQWLQRIDWLCGDDQRRQRLGQSARQLVCQQYTWQARLSQLRGLINQHLAFPSVPQPPQVESFSYVIPSK